MKYLESYQTRQTHQQEKIPRKKQIKNNAGGYVFEATPWHRLDRFLILGSEGGSYYVPEHDLTRENADNVMHCIKEDPPRTIRKIETVSTGGLAPKNDPALFALAMAASDSSPETRRLALLALPTVARTGAHLFHFVAFCRQFRGWGRGLRTAVRRWYEGLPPDRLALQLVKYQSRDGWSHRDLLRLTHLPHKTIFRYAAGKATIEEVSALPRIIQGFEKVKKAASTKEAAEIIESYSLPRECVPTPFLKSPEVWDALLGNMPMMAMVRNLGNMAKCGLLIPFSLASTQVIGALKDEDRLRKSRLHPIQILSAIMTYGQGHGVRGSGKWVPDEQVLDALGDAFETSFKFVEPSGKRFVLGLDISGSMSTGQVSGVPGLTPRVAACAMALITARTEPNCVCMAFTDKPFVFTLSKRMDIRSFADKTNRMPMGYTDCALPMIWALENKIEADTFVIYTDSETWAGKIHPTQALTNFRAKVNPQARSAIVAMVGNRFSIADPDDAGMLDVIGFDTSTPSVLSNFSKGRF